MSFVFARLFGSGFAGLGLAAAPDIAIAVPSEIPRLGSFKEPDEPAQ